MPWKGLYGKSFNISKPLKELTDNAISNFYSLHPNEFLSENDLVESMLEARNAYQDEYSYEQFIDELNSYSNYKNFPKVSESQRKQKEILSKKAAIALTKITYRASDKIPKEISDKLGGKARTFCSILGGIPNKETIQILNDGTPKQLSNLAEKTLSDFTKKLNLKDFDRPLTDEELVEKWPEISQNLAPLVLEYKNFMDYIGERGGSLSTELQNDMAVLMNTIGPYYSYYQAKVQNMSGEFYSFFPDDMENRIEEIGNDFENIFDNAGILRSLPDNQPLLSSFGEASISYAFSLKGNLIISGVYLEDGTYIDPKNYAKIGEVLHSGKQIFVYNREDKIPQVITSKIGMPPEIKKHEFDLKKHAQVEENHKEHRKAYEDETRYSGYAPDEPSEIQRATAEKVFARQAFLTDELEAELSKGTLNPASIASDASNIRFSMMHPMLQNICKVYHLSRKRDDVVADISNAVAEGKSWDEIKELKSVKDHRYVNYAADLYKAALLDKEKETENIERAKAICKKITVKLDSPSKDEIEKFSSSLNIPVRSEEEKQQIIQRREKLKEILISSAFNKDTVSIEPRWANILMGKPGLSREDAAEISELTKTKEGQKKLIQSIFDEIKSFDGSLIGKEDMEAYINNYPQYAYMKLLCFDYSYLNTTACKELLAETYPDEKQRKDFLDNFQKAITGFSDTLHVLEFSEKLYTNGCMEYFNVDGLSMDQVNTIFGSGSKLKLSRGLNALLGFQANKDARKMNPDVLKERQIAFQSIANTKTLEFVTDIKNPIIEDLAQRLVSAKDTPEGFRQVKENLASLCIKLQETEDKVLESKDLESIKSEFEKYFKSVNDYLEANGNKLPADIKVALRDSQIPLKFYADSVKEGGKLADVFNDYSWVKNVFNTSEFDDSTVEKEKAVVPDSENPVKAELDAYKAKVEYMDRYYNAYIAHISGDSENSIETIKYKSILLDKALVSKYGEDYDNSLAPLSGGTALASGFLKLDDPQKILANPIINDKTFDLLDRGIGVKSVINQIDQISKDLTKHNQDNSLAEEIKTIVAPFKQKSSSFGLQSFNELDTYTKFLSFTKEFEGLYSDGFYGDRNPETDTNDPLHKVYLKGKAIQQKAANYLAGTKDAPCPEVNDFEPLITEMTGFILGSENYIDGERGLNRDIETTVSILETLGEGYPQFTEKCQKAVSDYKENIRNFVISKNQTFSDYALSEVIGIRKLASTLQDSGIISADLRENIDAQYIVFFEEEREIELGKIKNFLLDENNFEQSDSNTNEKKYKQGIHEALYKKNLYDFCLRSVIEKQRIWEAEDYRHNYTISKTAGTRMQRIMNGLENPQDIHAIVGDFVRDFKANPGIQQFLNSDINYILSVISQDNAAELIENIAMGETNLLKDVSQDTMDIFAQKFNWIQVIGGAGFKHDNSDEFDTIAQELMSINQQRRDLKPVNPEAYLKLYEACADYVNKRSPEASTERGVERFAAASDIMLKLGLQLREKLPQQRKAINRDLRNTAIRSAAFRERLYESGTESLKDFAYSAMQELRTKNVTDRIKTPEDRQRFLNNYPSINKSYVASEMNRTLFKPSTEIAITEIKEALLIKDENQRIEKLAGGLAKLEYYSALSSIHGKLSVAQLYEQNDEKVRSSRIEILKEQTKAFVSNISMEALGEMSNSKDFKNELMGGFKLFSDLQADQLRRHPEAKEVQKKQEGKNLSVL